MGRGGSGGKEPVARGHLPGNFVVYFPPFKVDLWVIRAVIARSAISWGVIGQQGSAAAAYDQFIAPETASPNRESPARCGRRSGRPGRSAGASPAAAT